MTDAHAWFLSEVCLAGPQKGMDELAELLTSRGETLLEPGVDASLHPLLVPLSRGANGEVTGLLRRPSVSRPGESSSGALPVVRTVRDRQLTFLAGSALQHLHTLAARADADGAADAAQCIEIAARAGVVVTPGTAASSAGGVPGYLLTKVGPSIAAYEELAGGHLAKGSVQSALISCERAANLFGEWGRPPAFYARLLASEGRGEEARDAARQALSAPLWSLDDDLDEVVALSEQKMSDVIAKLKLRAAGDLPQEVLLRQNGMDTRTPAEIALDRAMFSLDLLVADPAGKSFEDSRAGIAKHLEEARQYGVATLVSGAFKRDPDAAAADE